MGRISILSQVEFLAFPKITRPDRDAFRRFSDRVDVVGLDRDHPALIDTIVDLRRQYRLKLPDAIVAATAVERNAILVTDDTQLRKLAAVRSSATS